MAHRASGCNPDQPAVHPDIVIVVPHPHSDPNPDSHPGDNAEDPELVGYGPLAWEDVLRFAPLSTFSTLTVDDHGRPLRLSRKHPYRTNVVDTICAPSATRVRVARWTSAATSAWPTPTSGSSSGTATEAAPSPAATGPPPGAKPTTSSSGATAGAPTSTNLTRHQYVPANRIVRYVNRRGWGAPAVLLPPRR